MAGTMAVGVGLEGVLVRRRRRGLAEGPFSLSSAVASVTGSGCSGEAGLVAATVAHPGRGAESSRADGDEGGPGVEASVGDAALECASCGGGVTRGPMFACSSRGRLELASSDLGGVISLGEVWAGEGVCKEAAVRALAGARAQRGPGGGGERAAARPVLPAGDGLPLRPGWGEVGVGEWRLAVIRGSPQRPLCALKKGEPSAPAIAA